DENVVEERHVGETKVQQRTAVPGAQPAAAFRGSTAARTGSAGSTASTARTGRACAARPHGAVEARPIIPVGGSDFFAPTFAVGARVFAWGTVRTARAPSAASTARRPLRRQLAGILRIEKARRFRQ